MTWYNVCDCAHCEHDRYLIAVTVLHNRVSYPILFVNTYPETYTNKDIMYIVTIMLSSAVPDDVFTALFCEDSGVTDA